MRNFRQEDAECFATEDRKTQPLVRCLSSWNSSYGVSAEGNRAEFSHQYFLVTAETCLQIFTFVIGALRSVSGQTKLLAARRIRITTIRQI